MADDARQSICYHQNVTSSSDVIPPLTSWRFIGPVAALVTVNLVVIVGNSLVIAAVFTYRKLRTVTNTFIVSLAVSDLLLGAVVLPFSSVNEVLGWWPFGRVWCSAWLAIDVWVCTASILNLCAISLDRYLAISRPFRYPTLMSPTRAKIAVAVVWTLALAICLPPLLGWRDSKVANVAFTTTTRHRRDTGLVHHSSSHISVYGETKNKIVMDSSPLSYRMQTRTDNEQLSDSSTDGLQTSLETGAPINNTKHLTTNSVIKSKRSNSNSEMIRRVSSITRRVTDDHMTKKKGNGFSGKFATASNADVAANAADRNRSRFSRRSGPACDECVKAMSEKTSADWDLVDSDLSVDALTTAASLNASSCRLSSAEPPHPVCMLTSEPGYIIYSACGSFWIPMLVMVFFYLKIYRTAVKATNALNSGVLTKKTGKIAASNERVSAVNLRVHRGGGGGGGTARTPGGNCTSVSNRLSNTYDSLNRRKPQYVCNVDDRPGGRGRHSIHGRSMAHGRYMHRPMSDRNVSHGSTAISGCGADAGDGSRAHVAPTGCCAWNRTSSSQLSSPSQHDSEGEWTGAPDVTCRRTRSLAAETDVRAASRRRRRGSRLPGGSSSEAMAAAAAQPERGVECLVETTLLTPVFEQCSGSSSDGNVELVTASQAHARRRFVQIRTQLRRLNREKKAAKTLGVIVGCFVLCWAPFFTVYVLGVFCGNCTPPVVFIVFFWLGYCNSAINPFVYALCSRDFRFAFRRLLRCGCGARRHHGSNPTIGALITRLRNPAPHIRTDSVIASVRFSAINRQAQIVI